MTKKQKQQQRQKQRKRIYEATRRLFYRHEILAFFGNKCIRCKITDWRVLQIDHKDGDGYKEKINWRSSYTRLRYIREYPKEARKRLQLLCANCNWIKRVENNETHYYGRKVRGQANK